MNKSKFRPSYSICWAWNLLVRDRCFGWRYGLDANSPEGRAHFLCDAWTGFFSSGHGEQIRRDQFYDLHNIEAPTRPPGGWSSHGQPCDQVHSMFRARIRSRDVSSLGFCGDLRNRPRYSLWAMLVCFCFLVPISVFVFFQM